MHPYKMDTSWLNGHLELDKNFLCSTYLISVRRKLLLHVDGLLEVVLKVSIVNSVDCIQRFRQ